MYQKHVILIGKETWKKYIVIFQLGLERKGAIDMSTKQGQTKLASDFISEDKASWSRYPSGLSGKRTFLNNIFLNICVENFALI